MPGGASRRRPRSAPTASMADLWMISARWPSWLSINFSQWCGHRVEVAVRGGEERLHVCCINPFVPFCTPTPGDGQCSVVCVCTLSGRGRGCPAPNPWRCMHYCMDPVVARLASLPVSRGVGPRSGKDGRGDGHSGKDRLLSDQQEFINY